MQKKGNLKMWVLYALLSAFFASVVAILSKLGLKNINSTLATAIRTVVVLIMAWAIVFITGQQKEIANITTKSLVLLVASGLATGLSWLFYFKALQLGSVSKVVPIDKLSVVFTMVFAFIILGEKIDLKTIIGGILITGGTFVLIL